MAASAVPFPIEEATIAALRAAYLGGPGDRNIGVPSHLDRIAVYDRKGPALGAILIDNPDALADAAALDAALESTGKLTGPLHGIPILVKANYDVAGLQTTGGSGALLGWVPATDATVIARIRAAGGIIPAKTTMSEWARGGVDNINSVLPGLREIPTTLPALREGLLRPFPRSTRSSMRSELISPTLSATTSETRNPGRKRRTPPCTSAPLPRAAATTMAASVSVVAGAAEVAVCGTG